MSESEENDTVESSGKSCGRVVKSYSFPDGDIRGDTFYIKHLSANFTVIDCYLKDGDDDSCRKSEIIDEIVEESSGRICRFISTHPDNDHIRGIEDLDKDWEIINFYAVENNIAENPEDKSLTKYIELKNGQKAPIRKGLRRAWLNCADKERGSSGIRFLWPDTSNEKYKEALEQVEDPGDDESPRPNNISCVILYCVEAGASYMWFGDMETEMQEEFYDKCKDELGRIDVLFHPHHGRMSAKLPDALFKKLDPQIIVLGNAPNQHLNYENSDRTITQNKAGDIVFLNDTKSGYVHVYTKNDVDNLPKVLEKINSAPKECAKVSYRGSFKPR